MKKVYFVLASLLIFSSAQAELPPVEYGTNPYTYNYQGSNPAPVQQNTPYQTVPYQQQYQQQYQPAPAAQQPDTVPPQAVQQLPTEPSPAITQTETEDINLLLKAKHKFALVVPLTGKGADIGKALRDAARLALAEKNVAEYAIIPIDVNEAGAASAAEKAVGYGVEAILGPVFSDDVGKVAKVARKAKLKVFSFSNNKAVAGGGVYVFGLIPSQQVERMLIYSGNRGLKNYSAIVPNNIYGHQSSEMVRKFAGWIGGKLIEIGLYSAKTPTSTAAGVVSEGYKGKGMKPKQSTDGVIIVEGGEKLKSVVNALSNAGVGCGRVRCLGVSSWDDKKVIASPALSGAWYAASPYEDVEDFLIRFQQKYHYMPDEISSLGYDIANFAIDVAPAFSRADIEKSSGFKGIKGIYRFTSDGINQRGYAVYEIRNGLAQVIDSAPNRF